MKTFVNNTISELTNNKNINKHSLVNVLVESVNNSIKMGVGTSSAYSSLKRGLTDINEHLKNESISDILSQFDKFESSNESKLLEISNEIGIAEMVKEIKESKCYSDPVVMHKVTLLEESLSKNPQFKLAGSFVNAFSSHSYDSVIRECLSKVETYIFNNQEKLLVLDSINEMSYSGMGLYKDQIDELSKMLVNESYSSEAIDFKLNSELPVVNKLVNNLSMLESTNSSKFTIANGNSNCKITNTIVPAIKLNESGIVTYLDGKFINISNELGNKENLSTGKSSCIREVNPEYVKENMSDFYELCEAFHSLGFTINEKGNGVISNSIRNMVFEFKSIQGNLNVYINDNLIENPSEYNFSEALMLESTHMKSKVSTILNSSDSIFNFEFIKGISNNITRKEAYIIEANGDYHVCEKLNSVERDWKNDVNEHKLYNYVLENFKYDISPIFKVKIDESTSKIKQIESEKEEMKSNVKKLEEAISKIDKALSSGEIDSKYSNELENIKESLESKIISIKESIVEKDLKKKELV